MLDILYLRRPAYAFRPACRSSTVRPDDLAGLLLARLAETSGFAVDDLEDVILGCTNQAGEDSRNLARNARCSQPVGGAAARRRSTACVPADCRR